MSIATKFAYLTETKNLIRAAINAKGGTLTTDSTFRSYAAAITALSGGGSGGSGGNTVTKYSTWADDFSAGISNVANDSHAWYELSESGGRLSAILREPDTTAEYACFVLTPDKKIDLTDGAYLSVDIQGIQDGTPSASSSWNNYTCVGMRLKDKDGAYSSWIEIDANGLGAADGIGPTTVTISHADISSHLGDVDRANVAAIEIQLIGWPVSKTVTFKARDKGVYIDNLVLSNSASATSSATIEVAEEKVYERTTASYSTLSTTDFNDAQTVYQAVKTTSGDRVMFIVRHSERDSSTGKQVGLNANGVSLVTQYAGSKLTGAPFDTVTGDAYYSTNVKRTVDTSYLVGTARSNSNMPLNTALGSDWESCTVVDHSGDTESSIAAVAVTPGPHTHFNDSFSGGTDWNTAKNYYSNNQSECTTKCEAAINWLAEDSEGHPFTFLSSHDLCMIPFVCWATGNGNFFSSWNNDYDSNPTGWLNYLAGVAVIVHTDGSWEVYPVKLLDSGKFQ